VTTSTFTPSVVEERLTQALIEIGGEAEGISRDATLADLDLDSLDLVELGMVVEEEWGVELRAEDVKGLATLGEIFDVITAKVAQS